MTPKPNSMHITRRRNSKGYHHNLIRWSITEPKAGINDNPNAISQKQSQEHKIPALPILLDPPGNTCTIALMNPLLIFSWTTSSWSQEMGTSANESSFKWNNQQTNRHSDDNFSKLTHITQRSNSKGYHHNLIRWSIIEPEAGINDIPNAISQKQSQEHKIPALPILLDPPGNTCTIALMNPLLIFSWTKSSWSQEKGTSADESSFKNETTSKHTDT